MCADFLFSTTYPFLETPLRKMLDQGESDFNLTLRPTFKWIIFISNFNSILQNINEIYVFLQIFFLESNFMKNLKTWIRSIYFHDSLYTIFLLDPTLQVNNYEIVVNFFHISHNLTWYSAIVHFTRIYVTQCVQLMNWQNHSCKLV